MRYIAHRGNFAGPDKINENNPHLIQISLEKGFDVEVDVRYKDNNFWLGHDDNQYIITDNIFRSWNIYRDKIWLHAKNSEAFDRLMNGYEFNDYNIFWHQKDEYTLTNKGYIWVYPNKTLLENCIWVLPEYTPFSTSHDDILNFNGFGICSDYISNIKRIREGVA